jgi:hypothetical protein
VWRLKPFPSSHQPNRGTDSLHRNNEEFTVLENFRIESSVLADLGPLPEVVETDSETTWKMFVQLEAQHSAKFCRTRPSELASLCYVQRARSLGPVCVDDVMAEARRFNRICPVEAEWLRLGDILREYGGSDAPATAQGATFRRMPPLARRMAIRDQVEWAAERGCLPQVAAFIEALPEDRWIHMGD